MEEFRFITAHFDLHQLWIGVFQGNPNFMDGTPVDPRVAAQFDPLVPWAWPDTLKGYICRRKYGDTKGEEGVWNLCKFFRDNTKLIFLYYSLLFLIYYLIGEIFQ
jgi:hypothetical protein